MTDPHEVAVAFGDGVVTIKKTGISSPIIAGILGTENDASGVPVRVWLDRLVHGPLETWEGTWQVSGAVSSILTRSV